MVESEQHPDLLDQAADAIDKVVDTACREIREGGEAVDAVGRVIAQFLANVPAEPDEVELLLAYARESVHRMAEHPAVADPVLEEYLEEVIRGVRVAPQLQAHLGVMLDRLEVAIRLGDEGSVDELVALCRAGRHTHRHLVELPGAVEEILDRAHDLGRPEALAAAVRPTPDGAARLAHHYWQRPLFIRAVDLLAHLAAEPGTPVGERAREALVELVGFVETAGEAALRLPVHLLSDEDRARLLAIHESRVDLFGADPVQVPVHLSILRDNRVIRSVLWQAQDATHL